ncbi:hypothetical protein TRVA0_010S00298 [Trichomonascus vanleenenianus]|uniref:WW domain-containing protein n=1 Tax=Trichomonascus vanleenenianus TaxID=2268995 RepID=UPI003ECAA777
MSPPPPPPPLPLGKVPERKPDVAPPIPPGAPPTREPDVPKKDLEKPIEIEKKTKEGTGNEEKSTEDANSTKKSEKAVEKKIDEKDDGWEAIFDPAVQQYYFYNKFTKVKTWKNPRVPEAKSAKDLLMEQLSKDPEFQALSKFERVKRYQQELEKLEDSEPHTKAEAPSPSKQEGLMKDFKTNSIYPEDTNNVNTLANMISQGRSLKTERKKAKVTKQQLSEYKRKREERKKKNMDKFFA